MAILIQEQLGEIGIDVTLQKVPGANWFARMLEKDMPMVIASFYAWLDWPEYHFYWHYHGGNNSVFNAANYTNDELDAIIDEARITTDPAKYDALISEMIKIVHADVPKATIARNYLDVALQPNVGGYRYWFHTQLDFRALTKE
jgi:peptide/nickel transport system substrate-binding protein